MQDFLPKRVFEDWSSEVSLVVEVEEPAALSLHGPGPIAIITFDRDPAAVYDYPGAPMDREHFEKVRDRFSGGAAPLPLTHEGQGRSVTHSSRPTEVADPTPTSYADLPPLVVLKSQDLEVNVDDAVEKNAHRRIALVQK